MLKVLLTITSLLYFGSGSVAIVAPASQLALYGVPPGDAQSHMAQWAGIGSVAIGLFAWFVRRIEETRARRGLIFALVVYFLMAGVISLQGTLAGVMSRVGWVLVAVNAAFALSYGSCLWVLGRGKLEGETE